jgi:hypothetical protein
MSMFVMTEDEALELLVFLVTAARWAPSGGNRRLHRFVAIQRWVVKYSPPLEAAFHRCV